MTSGLLAGVLVAAATAAVPAEKDGKWIEVKSPAFVVLTDAGAKAARRTISRFERIRAAFVAAMPSARLSGERELLVVAARNEKSLRSLIPEWWEKKGGIRPSTVHLPGRDHVFLLIRTDLPKDDFDRYHAAHWGYASYLLSLNAPRLPLWVHRGLADFYARTTVQKKRILVGRPAASHLRTLRERGLMPLTALWAVDRQSPDYLDRNRRLRFDAESWAFVHYLMLGDEGAHREKLARFIMLLERDGKDEDAAREAFGDPRALEEGLGNYIHLARFYSVTIDAEVDGGAQTSPERPLSSAEALTMRAAVHLESERYVDAHACLDEALRRDPKLAWAHELRAALAWTEDDPVVARQEVEQALALEPGRPLATRLQERVFGPPTAKGAERLCDSGDLEVCTNLGGWLIDGDATTPDPSRGVALIEKSCAGGHAEACAQLAWRYREGMGVKVDGVQAAALLERACVAGDSRACLAGASDHMAGRHVPADPAAAARMLQLACKQGERTGCLALAGALETGEGVPRDLERAAALYQDGCQAGDGASCSRLGMLYLSHDGLPTDHARAKEFLTKGCEQGDQMGCSNLEMLNRLTSSTEKPR